MSDTATQQGVETEVVEVPENPRNSVLAEIAAKAREERDKDIQANGETPIDTSGASEEPPQEAKATETPEPLPTEGEEQESKPAEAAQPDQEMVTIKVDGELRQVPKDKILDAGVRTLQKESAADRRLEEANRLLEEIKQKLVQPQPKQEPLPSPKWDDATIAYALEHGDENQKTEAVRQLREREPYATPEQIAAAATSQVLDTVDFRSSAEWFMSEYKDIASDPYLMTLAANEELRLRNAGDRRTRREMYRDIGDSLRQWRGGSAAATTLEEKKQAKATITNLPTASARKQAPEQPKPKTPSDIIEDMRKRRGQA